ncbi:hypothetical protein NBRC116495_08870 [Aurantivibrio plasticivorans]
MSFLLSIVVNGQTAVALPHVSPPLVVTETSRPYLDASEYLRSVDYVEEEFFLSGMANVYDWAGEGQQVKVVAGPTDYTTRILVRRPKDPSRFSGNVEVLILNASGGVDLGGPIDVERMVAQGDAWVGITSKAISARALQTFDSERYSSLNWNTPFELSDRCDKPSIIPTYMTGDGFMYRTMDAIGLVPASSFTETEDGLIWDMLAQLALLLKSESRTKILPDFQEPTLYMVGLSQSSIYLRTWLVAFHDQYRTPKGEPLYDGYLGVIGPALVRLNQCSDDVALEDPRQLINTLEVPFISLYSEGEMWLGMHTRQPDAFSETGGRVTYEVTGGSHIPGEIPGKDVIRLGQETTGEAIDAGAVMRWVTNWMRDGDEPNDLIWTPLLRGAYHNLQRWVREDIRPPTVEGIQYSATFEIERDENGNAKGGIQMPYISVPTAAHRGYLSAGGLGGIMGAKAPFSEATLKALYHDQKMYSEQFNAATDKLLKGQWISEDDAELMKQSISEREVD